MPKIYIFFLLMMILLSFFGYLYWQQNQHLKQKAFSPSEQMCQKVNGKWLAEFHECEFRSKNSNSYKENLTQFEKECKNMIGGRYIDCASSCRNIPFGGNQPCVQSCVHVCSL